MVKSFSGKDCIVGPVAQHKPSAPEYVCKLLIKQREEHMNTITIMSTVEGTPNVTYTEGEVLRYIEKAKGIDELNDLLNKQYQTIRSIKENVRDFFSEVEWEDGEQTVTKSDVNELLERIGSHKLTSRYGGTFTITGTFQVEAEDADEAREHCRPWHLDC